MEKQRSFIEHSCCFVTLSKAKGVKIRHERFLQKPGQGAFVGGRGFAKDTELFYSGLIFHGEYNEVAMELAWKVASSISLPEDTSLGTLMHGLPPSTTLVIIPLIMLQFSAIKQS